MKLPQRTFPVHQVGMFRRDKRQEFPDPPGCRQCLEAEVVFQVQVLVFHPDRLAETVIQTLIKRRSHLRVLPEPVGQLCDVIIRCVVGKREQLKTAHVHGLLPLFQPEKKLIRRAKRFHRASLLSVL